MTVTEDTLIHSNIVGVNDILLPGQLIAVIVAVGGCFTIAMQLGTVNRKKLYGTALHVEADCYYQQGVLSYRTKGVAVQDR